MTTAPTRRDGLPSLPRRPWRPLVTLSALGCAVAIAAATQLGVVALFVVAGLAMILLAGGWVLLLGLPSPRGTTSVLAGSAVILLAGGALSQEARESLLPGAVALAMILEFVHQLGRRDGRPRLVQSVSASITGITLLTSMACVLLLAGVPEGVQSTVVVMAAVAAATLADLGLRLDQGVRPAAVAAVVLGGLAAAGAGLAVGASPPMWLLVLAGALAGGAGFAMRATQSVLPTLFGHRAQVASGIASVFLVGTIAYGLTWLVLGAGMMAANAH